jgi:hypothetical protein
MQISPRLRHRVAIVLLAPALGILSTAGIARADLLVNDLGDQTSPAVVAPQNQVHVAPAVAFCPHGPAAAEPDRAVDSRVLLVLLGVCVHPPISPPGNDPTGGSSGGGVISSSGGSKGGGGGTGTIASTSPEPGSLLIGLIGAGLAGLGGLARRRRLTLRA